MYLLRDPLARLAALWGLLAVFVVTLLTSYGPAGLVVAFVISALPVYILAATIRGIVRWVRRER